MEKTKKEIRINGGRHHVYMELKPVVEHGQLVDDVASEEAFEKLAIDLTALFNVVSDQPFCVEISEFEHGEDEPHCFAEIATIDEQGQNVVVSCEDKMAVHLTAIQHYMARNLDCLAASYAGELNIEVYMYCPETMDDGESPVENPLAEVLVNLACMQYYKTIAKCFPEWQTDYIDAPVIEKLGFV